MLQRGQPQQAGSETNHCGCSCTHLLGQCCTKSPRDCELLRLILENCTYRHLLCHLPWVNRRWNATIDESNIIQQHLLFWPWEQKDYPRRQVGQFNPFIFMFAYQRGEDSSPSYCYTFEIGPEAKDFPDDEDQATEHANEQFGWSSIGTNSRTTRIHMESGEHLTKQCL